jgi:alanyl-tRNA synthetase
MGQSHGELIRAQALITETLALEEKRFRQTLERGLRLLDEELARLPAGKPLAGEVAFKLYDTYGFPLDLTQDALRAKNLKVDVDGFTAAMARQRAEARKAWAGSGEAATETVWFELKEKLGATEFLGYGAEAAEGQIVAIVVDGKPATEAKSGHAAQVLVNQTPFYAESGGQMGDTGVLATGTGARFTVEDTAKKLGALHVHVGKVAAGTFKVGDAVDLKVDGARRTRIRANHSATHLLHAALRQRLGTHVTQKGSLVAPERLRFDISHPKPLSEDERGAVEADVNAAIRGNGAVETRLMTPDEAIEAGAMALFGEKYGDEVRVVSMGGEGEGRYSVELCGGTHVRRTGDIGLFKIVGEGAVAAGVRRIEALTGEAARTYFEQQDRLLHLAAAALKTQPGDVVARIEALMDERKKLERELAETRKALATGGSGGPGTVEVGGVKYLGQKLDGVPAKDLRGMVDELKKKIGSGVVALIGVADGKAAIAVGVTDDLTKTVSAVELVRAGAEALGGKGGGGRPDMAQAGGPDGAKAEAALAAVAGALGAKAKAA